MAGELDTEVRDKPDTCRRTAAWLGTVTSGVREAADTVHHQRTSSEGFWTGSAAEAARHELGERARNADELEDALKTVKSALEVFADEIDTVNRRMTDARTAARNAELVLNGTKILPPKPQATETAGHPGPPSGMDEKKRKAFQEIGETVADARSKQEQAHAKLDGALKNPYETFNTIKTHTARAMSGGLAAIKASSDGASDYFQNARSLEGQAKEMDKVAKAAEHSRDAAKTKVAAMQTRAKSKVATKRGTEIGKLAKKTGRLGDAAAADASKYVKGGSQVAKGASSALRALPYAGTAMTVGSEAVDYLTGTDTAGEAAADAGVSLTGGVAGGAIGTAVGSAICPGVGTVIGGALGSMAGDFLATKTEDAITGD